MAYANHEINALITIDPDKARDLICEALRAAGMHKGNAAKDLSCTHSTLLRWIEKLNLDARIAKLMKVANKEGWRYNGRTGRPKGTTIENGAAPRGPAKKNRRVKTNGTKPTRRIAAR